jgi:hypothetical protein
MLRDYNLSDHRLVVIVMILCGYDSDAYFSFPYFPPHITTPFSFRYSGLSFILVLLSVP